MTEFYLSFVAGRKSVSQWLRVETSESEKLGLENGLCCLFPVFILGELLNLSKSL